MKADGSLIGTTWVIDGARVADYLTLTKPRIVLLVLLTATVGFAMGAGRPLHLEVLVEVLLGTALLAGGGAALNQFLEREVDGRMERTANRPLPAARLEPREALVFGLSLSILGVALLGLLTNLLTLMLGLATAVVYVLVYTPLKRVTSWSVAVGAISGALPPVMGWTAASDRIGAPAWILLAVMFIWQLPHFLAIALLYRADYERGDFAIARFISTKQQRVRRLIFFLVLALAATTLAPALIGLTSRAYAWTALALGSGFATAAWPAGHGGSTRYERRVFLASLLYLPVILVMMALCSTA